MANLDKTQEILKKQFPKVGILPLHMDVRSKAQIKDGIAEITNSFGRLDIAVNNAGVSGSGGMTHEIEDEEIETVLDINLHGVYHCQKEELDIMVQQE